MLKLLLVYIYFLYFLIKIEDSSTLVAVQAAASSATASFFSTIAKSSSLSGSRAETLDLSLSLLHAWLGYSKMLQNLCIQIL
ncbi:hypothetical protein ACJX0J_018993, partial [Zea mays]